MEGRTHHGNQCPHALIVPYPSQGHINPLLQFAKRLVSKGVKATIATTHYSLRSINAPNIDVEPISDGFESGAQAAGNEKNFLQSFETNGSKSLNQLITKYEKSSDHPINCVVYDSFLPWALDVAKQRGVYGAAFFTNSATVCAIFCCVHKGLLRVPLVNPKEVNLVLPNLPAAFRCHDLPSFLSKSESYPAYLTMMLNQFTNLDLADWVFCNTFQDLEPGVVDKILAEKWPAKLIGPMVPSAYLDNIIEGDKGYGASLWNPQDEECKEWLNTKPPKSVVYISFGSMVSPIPEQMEQLANGFEESNLHFLWVIRDSQLNTLPDSFVHRYLHCYYTGGPTAAPTEDHRNNNDKGMIVTWCNQLEVLAHQAIGCFVTHCGWNSTLEGLSLGVPMIGVPQWSDQLPDAMFIEEVWRVGVRAKEDENGVVRKEELKACFKEVMMEGKKSREIKENASKWKDLAKKSLSHGGSSDQHINDFVRHLRSAYRNIVTVEKENGGHSILHH